MGEKIETLLNEKSVIKAGFEIFCDSINSEIISQTEVNPSKG